MSNNALQIDVAGADAGHLLRSKANIQFITNEEPSTRVVKVPSTRAVKMPSTRVLKVADVNAGGRPDLIIGNYQQSNQLLINQGNGEFKEVALTVPSENWSTRAIEVGDMNNDGFPDLIVGNFYEGNKLLLNQGDGTFKEKLNAIPNDDDLYTTGMAIADLNSDGLLDVVAVSYRQDSTQQVLLNQGKSNFQEVAGAISSDIYGAKSIAVADVNGDCHTDIMYCSWFESDKVLLNLGNGTFEELEGSIPNASSNRTSAIAVADMGPLI
jgi:hypothetical protein